jgi:hypothetical protein
MNDHCMVVRSDNPINNKKKGRGGWVAKINNKNERCFSLSKQTERTIDLVRHGPAAGMSQLRAAVDEEGEGRPPACRSRAPP